MIDLHVHSAASDGQHAPADVVRLASAAGLTVIALTDHDTLDGIPEALRAAAEVETRVIPGCEFSVAARWGELHLLGYFLPAQHPALNTFLAEQRANRRGRAEHIVTRLSRLGVGITADEVLATAGGGAVGRPHVARALVAAGHVASVDEAFVRYLGWGKPAFVPKQLPEVADVTTLIREAGAVSSAAHLRQRATPTALRELQQQGVDAVEVRHPGHDAALGQRIEQIAHGLGLLCSGGSDWHGEAAGTVARAPLGSITVPPEWLRRLELLQRQRRVQSEVSQ